MNDAKLDGKNGKSKRTRYPKEYQINAAKMVYEKGYSIDETARLLNCGRESVRRWVNLYDPSPLHRRQKFGEKIRRGR